MFHLSLKLEVLKQLDYIEGEIDMLLVYGFGIGIIIAFIIAYVIHITLTIISLLEDVTVIDVPYYTRDEDLYYRFICRHFVSIENYIEKFIMNNASRETCNHYHKYNNRIWLYNSNVSDRWVTAFKILEDKQCYGNKIQVHKNAVNSKQSTFKVMILQLNCTLGDKPKILNTLIKRLSKIHKFKTLAIYHDGAIEDGDGGKNNIYIPHYLSEPKCATLLHILNLGGYFKNIHTKTEEPLQRVRYTCTATDSFIRLSSIIHMIMNFKQLLKDGDIYYDKDEKIDLHNMSNLTQMNISSFTIKDSVIRLYLDEEGNYFIVNDNLDAYGHYLYKDI